MAALEIILKKEIEKIAKRNIRKELKPLIENIKKQKSTISKLKKQIAELKKNNSAKKIDNVKIDVSNSELEKARFSPILIKKLRKKLKLTQLNLAKLLGVTLGAVTAWEIGKTKPNAKSRKGIILLRKISPKTAKKLIEQDKTIV